MCSSGHCFFHDSVTKVFFFSYLVGMVTINTLNLKRVSSVMYMVPKLVQSNHCDGALQIHKVTFGNWHISALSYPQTVPMRMFPKTFFCFRHPFSFG
jgi:hypothetical protein